MVDQINDTSKKKQFNHYENDNYIPFSSFTQPYTSKNYLSMNEILFKIEFMDPVNFTRRFSVGSKENMKPSKSILLVGGTGVGKTSLINTLVNKVFGINFEDDFRLQIVEKECQGKSSAESQTDWITVYQFYHMPGMSIDYNLTIIDTPGLNDTRGLEFDKNFFERLEMVFKINRFCVDELHCIGIVTPSSATRLTPAQHYIYDGCMKMFGNDVKDIIHIMATFSDGSEPQIKEVLDKAGVYYTEIHMFNNSSIYSSNKPDKRYNFKRESWNDLDEMTGGFLSIIQDSDGRSLTQTVKTLENRRALYEKMGILESKFFRKLNKAKNQQLQEDVNNNHETITFTDLTPRRVEYLNVALNCNECKVTCHKPCYENCKHCKAMSKKGNSCLVCECLKSSHCKENFHYVNIMEESLTSGRKQSKEELKKARMETMKELIKILKDLKKSAETLKSIALLPKSNSIERYVGRLIEEKKDPYQIDILNAIRKEERNIQNLVDDENELEQLIKRLNLSCKEQKGIKNSCKVM